MMCSRFQLRALILISASIGLIQSSFSIDTDKPIEIAADSAMREEPSGETTYRGDVVLTQGTLKIKADSLVFTVGENRATLITARGNPATMTQQPDGRFGPIHAQAKTIEYQEATDSIRLIGGARILQDGAVIEGSTIEYLVTTQRVMAAGSPDKALPQRVKVTIPPNALREGS